MSATYDEVTYLKKVARTGGGPASRTRSRGWGSPLTFWKLQQWPRRSGRSTAWGSGLDRRPDRPPGGAIARSGSASSWIWLLALLLAAYWARTALRAPGDGDGLGRLRPLAPTCWPTGPCCTMEMPLVASSSAMLFAFWSFLKVGPQARLLGDGRARAGWRSRASSRSILIPADPRDCSGSSTSGSGREVGARDPGGSLPGLARDLLGKVSVGMVSFLAVMAACEPGRHRVRDAAAEPRGDPSPRPRPAWRPHAQAAGRRGAVEAPVAERLGRLR